MADQCESVVKQVGDADYQRLYLPARLTRDSKYPLAAGQSVTICVIEEMLLIGERATVREFREMLRERVDGGDAPTHVEHPGPAHAADTGGSGGTQ